MWLWTFLAFAHVLSLTHTQPFYCSLDFVWDNPGEPIPEKNIHSRYHGHQMSLICFILPVHFTCLTVFFHNLSPSFLVYTFAWHPPLHSLYISSPNHCLLFTAHAHTIATCFALVPRLCHLILLSLSHLLGSLSCSFTPYMYLTILTSARCLKSSPLYCRWLE